ncbi:hypothetical protein ACIOG4_28665 [Streptomyces microflavus]|uniref:hypothetical protein n=1 Tax=Streptomyces microflavus TaxID=1919 RepID=UPI00380B37D0
MTSESSRRALTAICKAAEHGYTLQVFRDGSDEPLGEKQLSGWPGWPVFPPEAAHAAGSELLQLGYMIWPDTVTADSLMGWHSLPDRRAWTAAVGDFDQLLASGE